jgi:MFS family permease
MSAFSGGNLVGILLAGSLPRPSGSVIRILILTLFAGFGIIVGLLGVIPFTWIDFTLLLLLGLGNGYIAIIMFTWMQTTTPKEMLGRMMSIVMFASSGLIPVSQAISGAVIKWDLTILFAVAGALTVLVTIWGAFQPGLKIFSESMIAVAPADD